MNIEFEEVVVQDASDDAIELAAGACRGNLHRATGALFTRPVSYCYGCS